MCIKFEVRRLGLGLWVGGFEFESVWSDFNSGSRWLVCWLGVRGFRVWELFLLLFWIFFLFLEVG